MPHELPFDIEAHLADRRGGIHFVAERDGEQLAIGKYSIGDFAKRHQLAVKWAANQALQNGNLLTTMAIEAELERAEIPARTKLNELVAEEQDDKDSATEAASYVDADLIAELAWNDKTRRADFIVYDRTSGDVTRSDTVEVGGATLIPPRCSADITTPGGNIPGTVLLPCEHDETGLDEDQLRHEVEAFVRRYVDLSDHATKLCVEYVLLSWVFDAFDEVPYLALRTADIGRGKSRGLETIGALCYRAILCGGGSTAAATLRLLHFFGGTLVADEYDQRDTELAAELTKIINQGFQARRPLVRCAGEDNTPTAFRCFGPKLFALRKGFADDATESRIISIWMTQRRPGSTVPISLPRAQFDQQGASAAEPIARLAVRQPGQSHHRPGTRGRAPGGSQQPDRAPTHGGSRKR